MVRTPAAVLYIEKMQCGCQSHYRFRNGLSFYFEEHTRIYLKLNEMQQNKTTCNRNKQKTNDLLCQNKNDKKCCIAFLGPIFDRFDMQLIAGIYEKSIYVGFLTTGSIAQMNNESVWIYELSLLESIH